MGKPDLVPIRKENGWPDAGLQPIVYVVRLGHDDNYKRRERHRYRAGKQHARKIGTKPAPAHPAGTPRFDRFRNIAKVSSVNWYCTITIEYNNYAAAVSR